MVKSITKHITDKLDIITILAFILLIIFCAFSSHRLSIWPAPTEIMDDTDNWYYKYHTQENGWLKMNISSYLDSHRPVKGQTYNLTSQLPGKIPSNHAIKFKTKNCWVTVSIDRTPIYTTAVDEGMTSAAYTGTTNHVVPIPSSAAGKELSISFIPCTNWDVYLIDTIYSGDANSLMEVEVADNAVPLLVSAMLIFIGVTLLFMGMLERHNRIGKTQLHLGIFAILFGLFSVNQLGVLPMFFGHPIFFYNANVLIMALIPYPVVQYAILSCEILPTMRHRIILAMPLLEFALIALSYVTGLASLFYSKMLALAFILMATIIAIIYHLWHMIKNQAWKKPLKHSSCLLYVLFLFSIILELITYFINHLDYYPLLISNYFLFAVALLSLLTFIKEQQAFADIGRNSEKLKDAAFFDSLTQLGNRTALNRDMEALEQTLNANSSIALIQLDINYLKRTNDVLGHIAGDRLLKHAAQAIRAGFNDFGKCYRFGGDEFIVILIDNPREKYNLGISAMESECERINRSLQKLEHVSIAYGIAYYEPGADTSLWRVQERADVAMYERKRKMKERATRIDYKDDRL